ncbi:hypothetical protein, partial [Prevotella corporis]|uniref:hypothetical protein n=1 Tax=Prevotella corporis TaxID=28128 RepID=UPI0023F0F590
TACNIATQILQLLLIYPLIFYNFLKENDLSTHFLPNVHYAKVESVAVCKIILQCLLKAKTFEIQKVSYHITKGQLSHGEG